MTTLFEKMGLSIEKYNGLAILLALLALCASIFAIFANGKPNVLKTNTASVSVPEKFRLNQYLGAWAAEAEYRFRF